MMNRKRRWRTLAACAAVMVGATACLPRDGKTTLETFSADWTYLASAVVNTDGIYYDNWGHHVIAEIPEPPVRTCDYQAMRIFVPDSGAPWDYLPIWEWSSFHKGCSVYGYYDMPDEIQPEHYRLAAYWGSNHTNGRFWDIGVHKYQVSTGASN